MSDKKKPDLSLAGKARKFGVPLGTLKKVYKRGVAAWNSGHRPGTTPQQWGHARVNSYLRKGKTYHTADKDLHEDINKLFERLIFVDADPEQIAAADKIRERGGDEREVWDKTGVWVAPNGKSVQEIPDNKLTIRPGSGNAKDYISHPDLTNKFPNHLDKMTVNIAKPISTDELNKRLRRGYEHAFYLPPQIGKNNTYILPHLSISGGTDSSMADAAVHELQHSVPGYGGADPASTKNYDDYWKNPNERIARVSARRRRLDPEQRRWNFPGDDLASADDQDLASQPRDDTPGSATPAPAPAKPNPPSPPTGSGSDFASDFLKRLRQGQPKSLRESQLVGTDEYRDYALAMTPGQDQEIQDAFPPEVYGYSVPQTTLESEATETSGGDDAAGYKVDRNFGVSFKQLRKKLKEEPQVEEDESEEEIEDEEELEDDGVEDGIDFTPSLKTRKIKNVKGNQYAGDSVSGFPVLGLSEAVDYHHQNNLSLIENVYRPGSEMFFAMILEAKRLYSEGLYTPKDEYDQDLLESDIGEVAEFEDEQVLLDYPYEEDMEECWKGYTQKGMKKKGDKIVPNCVPMEEENDPTKGKGIGKPFRSRGGGAVYVRNEKGNVVKVNFSQSGMKKRINEPARVKSFVARHNCYGNKDKTSASYWACRWPRYFSDSGQKWW